MISLIIALAALPAETPHFSPPATDVKTIQTTEPTIRQQSVLALQPMDGRCADGPLDISRVEKPFVDLLWSSNFSAERPVTLNFRIDETGRVLGLKRDPAVYSPSADLSPSLAASQFPAGMPRAGCSISYRPKRTSVADADIHDLIGYSIFASQRSPKEIFNRLAPTGSDCHIQRPAALLRAYPDFKKIPATKGRPDWSMVRFDIDASGKPVGAVIHATTGNGALDKASIDAVTKSRFAKAPKKGCIYPYRRRSSTLVSPQSPDLEAYRSGDGKCPADMEWKSKPALVYPDNFRRREIEGWAIISFDVAPWGQTGNAKVVAAEPAAEFGEAALNIIRGATVAPSDQGYGNCFEKVRYVMAGSRSNDDKNPD